MKKHTVHSPRRRTRGHAARPTPAANAGARAATGRLRAASTEARMGRPMMLAMSGLLLVVMSLCVQLWRFQSSEAAHVPDSHTWAQEAILSPYGASAGRIPAESRYRRLELAAPAVLAERAREMDLEARDLAARRTSHQRELAMRNDTRRDRLSSARANIERYVVQARLDAQGRRTVDLLPLGLVGAPESLIVYTMAITDSGARP